MGKCKFVHEVELCTLHIQIVGDSDPEYKVTNKTVNHSDYDLQLI